MTEEPTNPGLQDVLREARKPLFAALGAGDFAAQKIAEALGKARDRIAQGSGAPQDVHQAYNSLVQRGEEAVERLRAQPGMQRLLDSVNCAVDSVKKAASRQAPPPRNAPNDNL